MMTQEEYEALPIEEQQTLLDQFNDQRSILFAEQRSDTLDLFIQDSQVATLWDVFYSDELDRFRLNPQAWWNFLQQPPS